MNLLRRREPFVHEYERAVVDLGASWRDVEFVALDFEATGLDLTNDEVISYGAVPIRSGRIIVGEQRYSLVRPTGLVPGASSVVHRIRNLDLEHAPAAKDVARDLIGLLAGRVLVAHAAWVEVAFLQRLFALHNARMLAPVVDTAALARELRLASRIDTHEPHLEAFATELGVPVHDPHHALGDAFTTAQVFLVLAARLEREQRDGRLEVGTLQNMTRLNALLRPSQR